jgi:tetratricopeptide (TPR) repeat protein
MKRVRRRSRASAAGPWSAGPLGLVAILCIGAPHAAADRPAAPGAPRASARAPATPEQAATAVLAAHAARDDAALRALAGRDDPDPWLVADALVARGEAEAAEAFAGAARRKDTDALPAYVVAARARPSDARIRSLVADAERALVKGDAKAPLEALERVAATPDVIGVRREMARGTALRVLHRAAESVAAFVVAAEAAAGIGWLAAEADAYLAAVLSGDYGGVDVAPVSARWIEAARARGDGRGLARALNSAGVRAYKSGDAAKALALLADALREAESSQDEEGAARALLNLGNAASAQEGTRHGVPHWEASLARAEAAGAAVVALKARCMLARARFALGDPQGALEEARKATESALVAADPAAIAATVPEFAEVLVGAGEFGRALRLLERSLEAARRAGMRQGEAAALLALGSIHWQLGDPARGLDAASRAVEIYRSLGPRAEEARALVSLGGMHHALGALDEALREQEAALEIHRAVGDARSEAVTLMNVGVIRSGRGEPEEGLRLIEEGVRRAEALHDRPLAAMGLGNVALARRSRGELDASLAAAGRALALAREAGHTAGELHALQVITSGLIESGRPAEALRRSHEGLDRLRSALGGLADEEGTSLRARFSSILDDGVIAAVGLGDVAEASLFLEAGRAGALLEALASRPGLLGATLPPPLLDAEAKERGREALAERAFRAAERDGDREAVRAARSALDAARRGRADLTARIQREAKAAADVVCPAPATLEEIRHGLAEEDVLVAYALFSRNGVALVARRDDARLVDLGPTSAVVDACLAGRWHDAGEEPGPATDALRRLVVEPLALPAGTRRVLVCPDGALSYVPPAVLFPDWSSACVPSGTVLLRLLPEKGKTGRGVLALGDPDYREPRDPAASHVYRGGRTLVPLPGTREEVRAVGTRTLLGRAASERGLRDALREQARWRAVHLACHGLLDTARPAFTSLALTPSGDDDGFLTALDVFRMRIPADLVVLSACETGKGRIVKGEGIVGLTRAFMFAGAPRVVCSLWKVDDEATRALMTKFYALWNPKDARKALGTAAALRAAQEHVRAQERWKHPYFWAAWVLWGLAD